MFHVVLVQPEIPPNTGNIARLCLATGSTLHLIKPLGFSIDDKQLRRAGLDYWEHVTVRIWEDFPSFQEDAGSQARLWYFTTKTKRAYWDVAFADGDYLVFGRETKGLPEPLLAANPERTVTIPMKAETRSLNLATSVGIGLFEALRQTRTLSA